ncbi:MAG TPA: DUF2232 domain-containing protein [Gemmatimonadaceae bacterium]|nr:DUF2232 domain-containing protein [Gemmatimonadaceae bacterium]
MSDALAAPPRELGWTRIVLALAAFLLLSHAPVVRAAAPVVNTMLLLVPAIAACFVAGWWNGGSRTLMLAWVALAVLLLAVPATPGSEAYADLARSWGVLVAGSFGIVCILGQRRFFLGRATAAVGLAVLIAVIGMSFAPHAASRVEDVFAREFQLRNSAMLAQWAQGFPGATSVAPALREWAARRAILLQHASATFAAPLYPALLALESLAACAIAWGLYHRMSRARLGAPLAPLRDFRFSDELIWALVAGMTIAVLPQLKTMWVIGANLVVFFGALYALRGFGVLAWFFPQSSLGAQMAAGAAAVLLFPVSLPLALGLGVTDTWIDWRRRLRTASSTAGPGAAH